MSLLRKKPAGPELSDEQKQAQRQQRQAVRTARMGQTREARKATGRMQAPEPMRGVYAGLVLLAIAVFSYVSKDMAQVTKTVKHKSTLVDTPYPPHPAGAVLLGVLAIAAVGTIYFRRRLITVIAFMLTGAVGVDAPLPLADTDVRWIAFLVPAAYALWIYAFRMRKEQTAWIADHPLPGDTARSRAASAGSTARSSRSSPKSTAGAAPRARKGKEQPPVVGPNGKALPASTGRYTRPKAKPTKAAQPRS